MSGFAVHDINPDLRLRVARAMPPLASAIEAEIDRLWEAAQRRMRGALFNGQVFSIDTLAPDLLTGHWTEFRRIVAQMARPALFEALGIRPVAVNGLLAGPDGVAIGRRPDGAIYQAGEWQLTPAGSIDPGAARENGWVDWRHTLLAELEEEVGLTPAAILDATPLGLVEHAIGGIGSHVVDLGVLIRTSLGADAIRAAHAARGNGEYGALEIVPAADLPGFLAARTGMVNPQAPVFLRRAGMLL